MDVLKKIVHTKMNLHNLVFISTFELIFLKLYIKLWHCKTDQLNNECRFLLNIQWSC